MSWGDMQTCGGTACCALKAGNIASEIQAIQAFE